MKTFEQIYALRELRSSDFAQKIMSAIPLETINSAINSNIKISPSTQTRDVIVNAASGRPGKEGIVMSDGNSVIPPTETQNAASGSVRFVKDAENIIVRKAAYNQERHIPKAKNALSSPNMQKVFKSAAANIAAELVGETHQDMSPMKAQKVGTTSTEAEQAKQLVDDFWEKIQATQSQIAKNAKIRPKQQYELELERALAANNRRSNQRELGLNKSWQTN